MQDLLHVLDTVCLTQALEAAGIAIEKEHIDNVDKMRAGILIGTAMGGMATFAQAIEDLTQKVYHTLPTLCVTSVLVSPIFVLDTSHASS